jgi:hypothetical protein
MSKQTTSKIRVRTISERVLLRRIGRLVRDAGDGGQQTVADALGVSKGYLSDVINKRRGRTIGPKMAEALGYQLVESRRYRKIATTAAKA